MRHYAKVFALMPFLPPTALSGLGTIIITPLLRITQNLTEVICPTSHGLKDGSV